MKKHPFILSFLFILYLMILFYLVLFSQGFGRIAASRSYNLVPFDTIRKYIMYREIFGELNYLTNIYGNVLAFMPFGYFIFIFIKKKHLAIGLILPFLLSLVIEILQYQMSVGSLDVDDVILNTFGGLIVYITCYLLWCIGRRIKRRDPI